MFRDVKKTVIDAVRFGNTHLWVSRMQLSSVKEALFIKIRNLDLLKKNYVSSSTYKEMMITKVIILNAVFKRLLR